MCWDYRVMRRMPQLYRNGELVAVIDCSDLARSARFWSGVLGFTADRVTGGPYRSLAPESGEGIEVLLHVSQFRTAFELLPVWGQVRSIT
jgi:catechol 2,3-dioxygenase-like lactoylglutathione lyase family enzyme